MKHIEKIIDKYVLSGCRTITLDVFDTFLLRNCKSEVQRFYEVAGLHSKLLKSCGYKFSTKSLFAARMLSHKIGYRTAPLVGNYRDASIRHIFGIYMNYLNIVEYDVLDRLIEIEINYEKRNLRLNKDLYFIINKHASKEIDIYFISDMYLGKENIDCLIEYFAKNKFYKEVYVSSSFSAAKSTGLLFQIFLKNEKLIASKILHIGDNYKSDYLSPKQFEIKCIHLALSKQTKILRKLIDLAFKAKLQPYLY